MNELKPLKACPFCGGKADLFTKELPNGYIVVAHCKVCDAKSRAFFLENLDYGWWAMNPAQSAVEAWNRRTNEIDT